MQLFEKNKYKLSDLYKICFRLYELLWRCLLPIYFDSEWWHFNN